MVKVKGALDDAEEALRAELREIVEKLDNMEKAVDAMESARSDESEDTGFSYEYDERYFAEEKLLLTSTPSCIENQSITTIMMTKSRMKRAGHLHANRQHRQYRRQEDPEA